MKRVVVLVACLILAGCATEAQREAGNIDRRLAAADTEIRSCLANINADPRYNLLWNHLPRDFMQASLTQLTSTEFVTPDEVVMLSERRERALPCRRTYIAQSSIIPSLADIRSEGFMKFDDYLVQLVQRKIAWGTFVMDVRSMTADSGRRMNAAIQQVNSGLTASHQEEMRARQAAAIAFQRSENERQLIQNQQQILLQQQLRQFGQDRPVRTDCYTTGQYVNCTSR